MQCMDGQGKSNALLAVSLMSAVLGLAHYERLVREWKDVKTVLVVVDDDLVKNYQIKGEDNQ